MNRVIDAKLLVLAAAVLGLSGCVRSEIRISPDFGSAVTQDTAAQISDPDAHYTGTPAPGTDGAKVAAAVHRYETGKVIQPSTVGASSAGSTSGFDNGSSGGSGATAGTTGDTGNGGAAGTGISPGP
jgi:hypothetical protein